MDHVSAHRSLFRVSIEGLHTGTRTFEFTADASKVNDLVSEFRREIHVQGTIHRIGDRFHVDVEVAAMADLVCDLSLEDYTEEISSELDLEYQFDNDLASRQAENGRESDDVIGLFVDAKFIDLEDDIRQELALALPMKRIAPKYRNASFDDLHPEVGGEGDVIDDRWEALRKLKDRTSE